MGNKEKEFNDILDECLDRVMFGGETPEQCLGRYPELASELRPLLDAAGITSQVSTLTPSPDFKARARNELFTVLREAEENRSRSFFSFEWLSVQRRLATSIVAVLAVIIATGSTAAASMSSMPDDFLYPVKRATEQVQLVFTFTTLGKAEAYARLADERIDEIVYMAELNDSQEIEILASSLNSNLINIASLSSRDNTGDSAVTLENAPQAIMMTSEEEITDEPTMKSAMIEEDTMADDAETVTSETAILSLDQDGINEAIGASANEETASAPVTVEPVKPEVNVEIPPTVIDVNDPKAVLNSTIINQAASNISLLYELLDQVPESIKPSILRAIELSEKGYEIAIDSLQ